MTAAPSLASSRADSSPMPAVPPVISAVWSISSIGLDSFALLLGVAGHSGSQPVAERGGVEGHFFAFDRNDRAFVEHRSVILGFRVSHHLAGIAGGGEPGPDEVVHALLLRAGDINQPGRLTDRRAGDRRRHICGSDGLEGTMRGANRVTGAQ